VEFGLESQFNTADGSEFQVRGAAVLNDCLTNDVRRNGTFTIGLIIHVTDCVTLAIIFGPNCLRKCLRGLGEAR